VQIIPGDGELVENGVPYQHHCQHQQHASNQQEQRVAASWDLGRGTAGGMWLALLLPAGRARRSGNDERFDILMN
jgi:hypothetical protein